VSTPDDVSQPTTESGAEDGVVRPIRPPEHIPAVSAEDLVDGELPDGEDLPEEGFEAPERRYPSTIGGALYLVVLTVVGVGLGLVVFGDWRTGIRTFGAALFLGALARLVLKPRDAGMLAVRNKPFDAGVLVILGGLMVFLAGSIPDQV
jgi:hypothetical protein